MVMMRMVDPLCTPKTTSIQGIIFFFICIGIYGLESVVRKSTFTHDSVKGIDQVYFSTNIFETHEYYFLRSVWGEESELSDGE